MQTGKYKGFRCWRDYRVAVSYRIGLICLLYLNKFMTKLNDILHF